MTGQALVTRQHRHAVAVVTIAGGVWTEPMAHQLAAIADELVEDRSLRAIVLRSGNADFCSGVSPGFDPITVDPDPASLWARLRPPIISDVTGACRGVGLEMVLVTDIVVADATAWFALDQLLENQLPCWGGTQRLARAVRPAEATAMTLLGRRVDAQRAHQLGLVHFLAGQPSYLDNDTSTENGTSHDLTSGEAATTAAATAMTVATVLANRGPLALELAKEAVHRGAEMPLRSGLRLEGDLNHQLAATQDRSEGLRAFFDKRPPDFAGR